MRYTFASCVLDVSRRELWRDGAPVPVEPQVFDLLELVLRNRSRVVTKDEMIAAVWGGRIISESTFSSRIAAVRKAIGDRGDAKRLILTLPRRGVRFVGDVLEESEIGAAAPKRDAEPGTRPRSPRSPLSIAVLPFTNLTGDPEQDCMVDALFEDVATNLTRLESSFVVAHQGSAASQDRAVDMRELGREFDVRYALRGAVRRVGDRMRINMQIVDAETGGQLWADAFDDVTGSLASSDELMMRVVRALKFNLIQAAAHRASAKEELDAADLILLAGSKAGGRNTRENYADARALFTRALEIAPRSVEALVGLGVTNVLDYANFCVPPDDPEMLEVAEDALNRALDIEPHHARGRYGRAYLLTIRRRLEGALIDAKAAVDLDPSMPQAYCRLAQIETFLGRPEAAFPLTEKALRLCAKEPLSASAHQADAIAHTVMGNDEEALQAALRVVGAGYRGYFPFAYQAAALSNLDRPDEAGEVVAQMLKLHPQVTVARIYANRRSDHPAFLQRWQRNLDALGRAGLPEA